MDYREDWIRKRAYQLWENRKETGLWDDNTEGNWLTAEWEWDNGLSGIRGFYKPHPMAGKREF